MELDIYFVLEKFCDEIICFLLGRGKFKLMNLCSYSVGYLIDLFFFY